MSEKQLAANRRNARRAGRPKGSVTHDTELKREMRRLLIERANKEFGGIMDAILDSAKGHYVQVKKDDGEVKIYKKSPNSDMLKYLIDQVVGKPVPTEDEKLSNTNILIVHSEHTNLMLNAFKNYGLIADTGADTP